MDHGKLTGAVYVNLSKAFNTISHSALLNKLPLYGIHENELAWISYYVFNRKIFINSDVNISNLETMDFPKAQWALGRFCLYFLSTTSSMIT